MTCREAEQMVMPYIKGELKMETAKKFLEHVEACDSCTEELEIYYTIHYALEQLDKEQGAQYDIHKMLADNIRATRQYIYRAEILRFLCQITGALAITALIICAIVQTWLWI